MITNETVKEIYQGDGSTTTFAIPFTYFENEEVVVYLIDESDTDNITITKLSEGTGSSQYELTGGDLTTTPITLPTDVEMVTAPTSDEKLVVIKEQDFIQEEDYTSGDGFPAEAHEKALDKITSYVQVLREILGRVPQFPQGTEDGAGNELLDFKLPRPQADGFWAWDNTGENVVFKTVDDIGGGFGSLGDPTDGTYGGAQGALAGVANGDSVEDAFDKVETFLAKIAPVPPDDLSDITLEIPSSFSALEETSGTARAVCTTDTTPLIRTPAGTANGFLDGNTGVLSCQVDSVDSGSITLTTGNDEGTNSLLTIEDDYDFYDGVAGSEDIYQTLIASIQVASALALGEHTASMTHSTTGSTSLTFYIDDSQTPTISGNSITGSGSGTNISGVPSLDVGDTITADFTVEDAVGNHYNDTRIARAESSVTDNQNAALPGSPPADGDNVVASIGLTVADNSYSENASVDCIGYAADDSSDTAATTNNIRVDTVSDESARSKSGTGQYPTIGSGASNFGDPFDSTTDITTNEELQMLNGQYRFPPAVDYSTNTPTAGPDYSSISGGSYNNMRWATFNIGSVSSETSVEFTIDNTANFGSNTTLSDFELYVLVDGATPTSGWVDANAAYPGVGDPTNDGDAALDVGNSSATTKRVTFGTAVKTGDVWVRVGIPSGDNKRFGGLTKTS